MNWKRVWIGAAYSAAVLWLFDLGNLVLTQRLMVQEPNLMWGELVAISRSLVAPSLVIGFLLSWIYVLARPRLGPGPRTAILMGSVGFAFANPHFFGLAIWLASPLEATIQCAAQWLKFATAAYLAGCQYIEKAP